jgi:hypothetical protein
MRKNFNYIAAVPTTRNDFIDAVTNQKEAILVNHILLKELTEEINSKLSSRNGGGFFQEIGCAYGNSFVDKPYWMAM